jgi:hypothetical protein
MNRKTQAIQLLENELLPELLDNYQQISMDRIISAQGYDSLLSIQAQAVAIQGFRMFLMNECADMLGVEDG